MDATEDDLCWPQVQEKARAQTDSPAGIHTYPTGPVITDDQPKLHTWRGAYLCRWG